MTTARQDFMQADKQGTYHIYCRCVRKAYLIGIDNDTGKDYSYRKEYILSRIEFLSKVFFIDIFGFSIMSNHYHLVLRNQPALAAKATADEIADRWLKIHPTTTMKYEGRKTPIATDRTDLFRKIPQEEIRLRLSNISWFMRELNQYIAVKANEEEKIPGAFWDGRFKSQFLANHAAVLACMVYIDLNPVRAQAATCIDDSQYTSAYERLNVLKAQMNLDGFQQEKSNTSLTHKQKKELNREKEKTKKAYWLAPLFSEKEKKLFENKPSSVTPILPITLEKYLELVDVTGREYHKDKPGIIADKIAPILDSVEFDHKNWMTCIKNYGNWFYRVIGPIALVADKLHTTGQRWFKGMKQWEKIPKEKPSKKKPPAHLA